MMGDLDHLLDALKQEDQNIKLAQMLDNNE